MTAVRATLKGLPAALKPRVQVDLVARGDSDDLLARILRRDGEGASHNRVENWSVV